MIGGGKYESQLCVAIVEDLFGKIVSKVAETVLKESCQLHTLVLKLKGEVSITLIRKSLSTLINFGFIKFFLDSNMKALYVAEPDHILHAILAPRACLIAKTLYGPYAEAICEELFANGKLTCSNAVRRVKARDETATLMNVKKSFADLAGAQFIMKLAPIENEIHGCPQFEKSFDPFVMPEAILTKREVSPSSDLATAASTRKRKTDGMADDDPDAGEYWKINWSRFDAYFRDEMIINYLVAENASTSSDSEDRTKFLTMNVCRMMFKLNEMRSSSLKPPSMDNITAATYEILKMAKDNDLVLSKGDVEFACQVLCDESDGIVRKIGDSSGGLYQVDIRRAITMICRHHSESLIREQFETRAIRVMRLLETRHFLDEEQVEKLSMMSGKEAREMLYALVEEGYVFTKAIGRSNDFQPARTFYLYHVDLKRTIRGLVEYTCKLMRNLILRNAHERKENKNLIDKDSTVGPIVEGIRANDELDEDSKLAQIAEVEEMYLPGPDRAQLEKYRQAQAMLNSAQDQSARVLLVFKLFLGSK